MSEAATSRPVSLSPALLACATVLSLAVAAGVAGVMASPQGSLGEWTTPLFATGFWYLQLAQTTVFYGVALVTGVLVQRYSVKVNYTRKINHFALFFVPIFLRDVFAQESTPVTYLVAGVMFALVLATYVEPIRSRVPVVALMFSSFDRPEDRPHTLSWLSTQAVAGYLVLIPLLMALAQLGAPELIYIPILINAVGDGLAEPVGVRFGRRKYSVPALFTSQRYTRTLEGSACVLVTGFIVVALFAGTFTGAQLVAALLIIPLGMTLAEAFSPHTWDTPFLFVTGGLATLGILLLI